LACREPRRAGKVLPALGRHRAGGASRSPHCCDSLSRHSSWPQSQLRESSEETEVSDAPDPADGSHVKLVALMQQDAVIRKVALAYVIQRLEEADMASAKTVLLAAREVRHRSFRITVSLLLLQAISDELFLDEGPFAATLARLLASLVTANRVHPSSGFWRIAVDDLLLRAVCISTAIHEEVRSRCLFPCNISRFLSGAAAVAFSVREHAGERFGSAAGDDPASLSTWTPAAEATTRGSGL